MQSMLKFLVPVLVVAYIFVKWRIASLTSSSALHQSSQPLHDDNLDTLFRRLSDSAKVEELEVRVLPDRSPNGLVTSTGEIYITQGFIDAYRLGHVTAKELASVVAHELGHLKLGHTKRRVYEVAGRQTAQLVLSGLLVCRLPFFGSYLADWIVDLVAAKLSREDEMKADLYATKLMARSGIGAKHLSTAE